MTTWCEQTLVRAPLHIGLCTTEAEYMREMRKRRVRTPPEFPKWPTVARVSFFESPGERSIAMVCISPLVTKGWSRERVYAVLAHEAMHIWREIRGLLGEHDPSAEFEAYSMQSICEELFEAYAAKKKK